MATDPRQLEDKPSETEEKSLRTFFWGSVVLYAAFGIIGLAAVNTVIQFVQQVTLVCNTPMFGKIPASYINNYCYGEVSSIRHITAFNVVIGTLIAAPHYLWLNLAAERFVLFCSLVSKLNTVPNSETGHWSPENMAIVERVITVYSKDHSSIMMGYFLKIGIQLIFAVFGLLVTIYFFDGADVNFLCPRVFSNSSIPTFWPFNHQVQCIYGTLEALVYLRLTDVVFLGVIIIGLTMALLHCLFPVGTKGKSEDVAKFHVLSTLPYQYYRSHPLELLAFKSDLGFLVAELFRGHGEQAYCFWECLALRKKIELEFSEMARVAFLKDHYTDSGVTSGEQQIGKSDLKLYFPLGRSKYLVSSLPQTENNFLLPVEPIQAEQAENYLATPFDPHHFHRTEPDSEAWLKLEPDIRGAILSFVALPKKKRKVAVVLKYSTSAKFVSCALARVFDKVIQVNFRCDYKHKDPLKHVSISGFPSTRIKTATFHPYAVLEKDLDEEYKQFTDAVQELWKQEDHVEEIIPTSPTSPSSQTTSLGEGGRIEEDGGEQLKADFIVVCPIENEILKSATTTFLKLLNKKNYLSDEALLLSVYPLTVGEWLVCGRDVRDKFYEYLPPDRQKKGVGFQFRPRDCEHAREVSSTCAAMQDTSKAYINLECCASDQDSRWCRHNLPLQCGKVPCKFRFSLYERTERAAMVADEAESTAESTF